MKSKHLLPILTNLFFMLVYTELAVATEGMDQEYREMKGLREAPTTLQTQRFKDFVDEPANPLSINISTSYSQLSFSSPESTDYSSIRGIGVTASLGASNSTELTGLGLMVGFRKLGNDSGTSGWDASAGLDSVAYISSQIERLSSPGGLFLHATIGADYLSLLNEASASKSESEHNDVGSNTEIRRAVSYYFNAGQETPLQASTNRSSFRALGQFGVGYEIGFTKNTKFTSEIRYEYASGPLGWRGLSAEVGIKM